MGDARQLAARVPCAKAAAFFFSSPFLCWRAMAEGEPLAAEDDWAFDCEVSTSEQASELSLKVWAKEVWEPDTPVERDIDGCWFPAVVVSFERDATFSIKYTDDGNEEKMVEVCELRAPQPDGTYEYLSEEVAAAAAAQISDDGDTEERP